MGWRKAPKARVDPVHVLSGSQAMSGRRGGVAEGGPSAGLSWAWLGLHLVCSFPWPVVTSQAVPLPDAEMRGPLRPVSPWCISGPPSRPSAVPTLACVCLSESKSGL